MNSKIDTWDVRNPQLMQPDTRYGEEDDINLVECFVTLLKYKLIIFLVVFLSGVGAVLYSLTMTNIYSSEATIALRENEKSASPLGALGGLGGMVASQLGIGGGGSLEKLEVVLNSRELSARVIDKYELMPVLFAANWDAASKSWLSERPPTLQDAQQKIKTIVKIKSDIKKSTISVGVEHKDPGTAKKMVDYYLIELSNSLREEVFRDASENMRFFKQELENTIDPLLREKIYALLAKEIEKETFAKAQRYYGFTVLDPPIAADLDKKIKPKRSMICILSVFVAIFGAICLAFLIEFVKKIKIEDPTRYQQIVDGIKVWKITSKGQQAEG